MNTWFDALILGGGPAGSTAAWALARKGWRVALVEKAVFPRRKVCGEFVSATNLPLFRKMGVESAFAAGAGPVVRKVGLFVGDSLIETEMPGVVAARGGWGRALSRALLDLLLLDCARAAGVQVWQPWTAVALARVGEGQSCRLVSKDSSGSRELRARLVVAAHGSWECGGLPTQPIRLPHWPSDLMAFKAHFRNTRMALALMPLLCFPGGYGGMVHTDGGRLSVSFCVTREQLERCREAMPGAPAAEAVLHYVQQCCEGLRHALAGAERDDTWLAIGPIRPGLRRCVQDHGTFLIGNAAGEAHPAVAEGISMAIQSGWLLGQHLTGRADVLSSEGALSAARTDFARAWRRGLSRRIRASAVIAKWAMHPWLTRSVMPVLRRWPRVVALGARMSGKTDLVPAITG